MAAWATARQESSSSSSRSRPGYQSRNRSTLHLPDHRNLCSPASRASAIDVRAHSSAAPHARALSSNSNWRYSQGRSAATSLARRSASAGWGWNHSSAPSGRGSSFLATSLAEISRAPMPTTLPSDIRPRAGGSTLCTPERHRRPAQRSCPTSSARLFSGHAASLQFELIQDTASRIFTESDRPRTRGNGAAVMPSRHRHACHTLPYAGP